MYWYFLQYRPDLSTSLINFFNSQSDTFAFIPKIEQWYNIKSVKNYVIKDMYPNYIFIKCDLDENSFLKKYKKFFKSVENSVTLIKQGNSVTMQKENSGIFDRLFNGEDTIRHSIGNIVNSKLVVDTGPLVGLEDYVVKINRHHRIALLDFNLGDFLMKLPLEVKAKS